MTLLEVQLAWRAYTHLKFFLSKPDSVKPLCVEASSVQAFPYFASLGLILVPLTFFWYGGEKRPPHPQLLSGETRAAACQPATTQAHTVAFSVLYIQGSRWYTRRTVP